MDFVKQYILQSITTAANHLRLTSDKIESVTLLKEFISRSKSVNDVISDMKKVTELSKLGVRLGEILNYFNLDRIDFITVSDTFKEHSSKLVKELSFLLEITSPVSLKNVLERLEKGSTDNREEKIKLSLTVDEKAKPSEDIKPADPEPEVNEKISETEKQILEEVNITNNLVNPLRELAGYVNNIEEKKSISEDIDHYIDLAKKNFHYSTEHNLPEIPRMMKVVINSLEKVKILEAEFNEDMIEGLRSCLIVSLAQVKKKDVDVSGYLKKAELFGEKITKVKE